MINRQIENSPLISGVPPIKNNEHEAQKETDTEALIGPASVDNTRVDLLVGG